MSMRARIMSLALFLALLPLSAFFLGARQHIFQRFEENYHRRVEGLGESIDASLQRRGREIERGLSALAEEIGRDNRLWLALLTGEGEEEAYLRAWAEKRMTLAGMDMLQLLDSGGELLSSGHFRQERGQDFSQLRDALAAGPGRLALAQVRSPEGFFPALLAAFDFELGDRRFHLIGGRAFDQAFLRDLSGGDGLELVVYFAAPAGEALRSDRGAADARAVLSSDPTLPNAVYGDGRFLARRSLALPSLDGAAGREPVELLIAYPRDELDDLLRDLGVWLALVLALTLALSLALAGLLAHRLSRPVSELAAKAERLDLDKLDVDFSSDRSDELGRLSRLLQAMTQRLGLSARRLREAENRATLGEVARQVTHDIRNGFTPLRNVIAHLAQVAKDSPDDLPRIFDERKPTLDSGLAYLEDLAGNYSRLSARECPERCRLDIICLELMPSGETESGIDYVCELEAGLPSLLADPTALRRILENLLRNARESIAGEGRITLRAARGVNDFEEPVLRIEVEDTGCGVAPEDRERIFDDFFSSKEGSSGLGLSNVRRLSADLGGVVRLRDRSGRGSCFMIELPLETVADGNSN